MPYRDAPETSAICPRCMDTPLAAHARGHARVFACRACGGVFADRETVLRMLEGETRELLELAEEATRAPPRPKLLPIDLTCPMCERTMERVQVPNAHIPIDVCDTHGIWFDRWETQLVAREISNEDTREAIRSALTGT